MKNIDLICVGSLKNIDLKKIEENLLKNINPKYNLNILEVNDEKNLNISRDQEIEKIKNIEGKKILSKIKNGNYIITLEIQGSKKTLNINQIVDNIPNENISIIIGGSLGISNEVSMMSNKKISISNMTFPHQLMRLIILEQFC